METQVTLLVVLFIISMVTWEIEASVGDRFAGYNTCLNKCLQKSRKLQGKFENRLKYYNIYYMSSIVMFYTKMPKYYNQWVPIS